MHWMLIVAAAGVALSALVTLYFGAVVFWTAIARPDGKLHVGQALCGAAMLSAAAVSGFVAAVVIDAACRGRSVTVSHVGRS